MITHPKKYIKETLKYYSELSLQRSAQANKPFRFINWWDFDRSQPLWLTTFIKANCNISDQEEHLLDFVSVMGPRRFAEKRSKVPKIFFTAEDTSFRFQDYDDYLEGFVDLSLGFKETDLSKNRIYFPLWMIYFISPTGKTTSADDGTYYSIEDLLKTERNVVEFETREFDCSLIARHDHRGNGAGYRKSAMDIFTKEGEVLCAGSLYNNTNVLRNRYGNRIDLFLQNCKFNICLENTNSPGYVTEKLFQSIVNGAIPIYWGSDLNPEPNILTGDGIVFFNPERPFETQKQIQAILRDEEYRKNFLEKPIFMPQASEIINERFKRLKMHLSALIET